MPDLVRYELKEDTAHITIDDGKVNVMSTDMLRTLNSAFDRAEKEARFAVLRSARPGVFSAGFDVKLIAANDPERSIEMTRTGAKLALRLLSFPLPLIGVLEGHAFPMGTFLLLACDYRIAARGPHKMGLNEVAIGITPPGFAIELARSRIHPAWLSRTVTLGEMFEPEDALTAGFIDQIVEPGDIDETLTQILGAFATLDPQCHINAKRRLRQPTIAAMREAIDTEVTLDAYKKRASDKATERTPA